MNMFRLAILNLILFVPLTALHAANSRPNIVFLFTDDQTVGAMGCYGNKEIITPHMDKLAAEGVRFRSHYNSTAICMASRASVMTGLYEYRHGCNFSHGDLERRLFDPRLPKHHVGQTCEAVTANVDMTATIFALANVPAPEGIDGKNLLPLLANTPGRVRDWLPLFNHWGSASAQSMAVVSSEWKYIHWYYAGRLKPRDPAVKPTEELFHLAADRTEMNNLAADTRLTSQLAIARAAYDAELAAMKARVIQGHSYEAYPILFDRTTSWESKEPLLKQIIGSDASEGGGGDANTEGRKKAKRE
jgi:arylsulfatase A-like enzyme